MSEDQGQITQLLCRWAAGDRAALDSLTLALYSEMRKLAEGHFRRERNGHTLQPTALVNEAWMRLARSGRLTFDCRKQFFGLAAQVMRQVLVDYARASRAEKRGGGEPSQLRHEPDIAIGADLDDLLALNEAIDRLATFSPRQARVIELHYFAGFNGEEIAGLLAVSPATVSREQKSAEAWLSGAMDAVKR